MKRKVVLILKIIFSASLLSYILIKVPLTNIFNAIHAAEISLILIAIVLIAPTVVLSAYQTSYLALAQMISIPVKEIIKIYLTTSFYSVFLPGSISGGVIKWYKFSKFGTKSSAAAMVILNRFLEIVVVVNLGLLYSIPTLIYNRQETLLIIFVILLSLFVIGYSILFNTQFSNKLKNLIVKFPFSSYYSNKMSNLLNAFSHFQNLKLRDHLEMIGIMITYHLFNLFSFYLLACSLDIGISIFVLGWIGAVVTILSIFPITISGFGIREGTLIYLLGYYGILPQNAVALSFLAFFRTLIISLFGGLLELKEFILKEILQKNNKIKK